MSTASVIDEVVAERVRQDAKWGEQNHPDGVGPNSPRHQLSSITNSRYAGYRRSECQRMFAAGVGTWMDILEEEVAEAYAAPTVDELRDELIQVAAVAVAWIEAIDRRSQNAED